MNFYTSCISFCNFKIVTQESANCFCFRLTIQIYRDLLWCEFCSFEEKNVFSNSLMISAESPVLALVLAINMEDFTIISIKPRDTMYKV